MSAPQIRLLMERISKSFPGVVALDRVSFEARAGEVVGLVGVNGAGKSTLMNVLGGILRPDDGHIEIDGRPVELRSPVDAAKSGIAFIHQELLYFASLSVAENIFISDLFSSAVAPLFISKSAANRSAKTYLDMLGLNVDPGWPMERLSIGEKQIVEIARALAKGSEIVIFDEPTSSLSLKEKQILFEVVRRLRNDGKAIIYISHFLDELFELCDTFVVLRNGTVQGAGRIEDTNKNEIVKLIAGRELAAEGKWRATRTAKPVLKVENIRAGDVLGGINFELNEGEVLGVWGLMGSGRTELVRAILGLDPIDDGQVFLSEPGGLCRVSPRDVLRRCGYLTEGRHTDGLFLTQPVWKNISATTLAAFASKFLRFMNVARELKVSDSFIKTLNIATPGSQARVETLSGGNQQKIVLAKWLNKNPPILIMDEPTRGVDVGAKREIADFIRALAAQGVATLLITSELEEMMSLSDRVIVLREGRLVSNLSGAEIESTALMRLALTGESAHAG
jgi:ABC-type sugar transport system ATPase subunit